MENKDYQTSILVHQNAAEVFQDVLDVRGWWQGEILGDSDKLNSEFTYQMGDVHLSTQKVVELIPNEKIVWKVTKSRLNFVDKKDEWTGTTIAFEIQPVGNDTRVTFTHHGLIPSIECYGGCSGAWDELIQKSLTSFISTGKGVDVF